MNRRIAFSIVLAALTSAARISTGAQSMPVTADLKLDSARLLFQETTQAHAILENGGKAVLHNVNPLNELHGATILATDLATGTVTRHRVDKPLGTPDRPLDLQPGQRRSYDFSLTRVVRFPAPGTYELRAHYEWDGGGGEADSPPVKVEVLPSTPRYLHVETAQGGAAPMYLGAWVNTTAPDKGKLELWLAHFSAVRKPAVLQNTLLSELSAPIEPVLSIPPNAPPYVQWVAWTQDQKLMYLIHQSGQSSKPRSAPLPSPACSIVRPVLQNPPRKGHIIPGADVLLYARAAGAAEGQFIVMHLSSTGETKTDPPVSVPGVAPRWMETAYLASGQRHTFLIALDAGSAALSVSSWENSKPPGAPVFLGAWPGRCLAGDIWVTAENAVVGSALVETGEAKTRGYAMHTWGFENGAFQDRRTIAVTLPDSGIVIEQAVVSVNANGQAFALLQTNLKDKPWFYCSADGTAMPLPPEAGRLQLPAQILFRRVTDPTILFTLPGRGFQFAKP